MKVGSPSLGSTWPSSNNQHHTSIYKKSCVMPQGVVSSCERCQ